ncbi:hypothetical protein HID58_008035, partial [Brassica napus]
TTEKEEDEEEMAGARLLDMSRVPFSRSLFLSLPLLSLTLLGGYTATNNEFQRYGPKGSWRSRSSKTTTFTSVSTCPLFPDDGVRHRVDSVRQKVVFFSGEETLRTETTRKNAREYAGTAGLGKSGRYNMDEPALNMAKVVEDHPFVVFVVMIYWCFPMRMKSSSMVRTRRVYEHDESCRIFMGAVMEFPFWSHDIAWDAEFGVLTVRITPSCYIVVTYMSEYGHDGRKYEDRVVLDPVERCGECLQGARRNSRDGSGEETLSDKKNALGYSGTACLGCDCCEITGVDAKMKDGVLRMIVSRVKVKDHDNKCTLFLPPSHTGKSGRYNPDESPWNLAELEDHPFVVKGRVCGDDMLVLPNENEVKFYGENKEVCEHDESFISNVYLVLVLIRYQVFMF